MSTTALITGASGGLGRALAHALSKRGFSLILVARNQGQLEEIAEKLATPVQVVCCDLANASDRSHLVALIHKKQPELLINNAGFGLYGPALSHPTSEFKEMVEVNIQAVMELSLEGARALYAAQKRGTVLNISSAAAFFAYPSFSVYAATKAFVNSFSQSLDQEMKEHGIRILTSCPGQIDTGFRKRASSGFPQKKDHITLSPEKAVTLILKQIDQGKSLAIIDGRYWLAVLLSRLLPKRLLNAILAKSLRKRHSFKISK